MIVIDDIDFNETFEVKEKVNGKEITFKMRVLTVGDYIALFNKDGEADLFRVLRTCIVSPNLSDEQIKSMKLGLAQKLFKEIMERSFLQTEE